ncbi:MAG: DMT family transporter [Beijerinckiaceae bacterium]|jgi:drug/metabolite transporter (DMT)-like permease|nr:DMT family transporter [Beijerinckiaceae bacterium]
MQQSQTNLRGIVAMMLAMLFFIGNDALMKYARTELDTGQALVVRGLFSLALLVVAITVTGRWRELHFVASRFAVTRASIEGVIATLYIAALAGIGLAEATAITMLVPLIITAFSTIFLGEKVGWRRWSAITVGFIGILLVLQPEGRVVPYWAVSMVFAGTILIAVRDTLTRRMPANLPSMMLTVTTTCGTLVAGGSLALYNGVWKPLPTHVLLALAGAGFLVLIGNYAIIEAYRKSDLSVVSSFRYSVIVWAVLIGFLMFGDVPGPLSVIGLVLILASGVYTIHRERVRRREERESVPPA